MKAKVPIFRSPCTFLDGGSGLQERVRCPALPQKRGPPGARPRHGPGPGGRSPSPAPAAPCAAHGSGSVPAGRGQGTGTRSGLWDGRASPRSCSDFDRFGSLRCVPSVPRRAEGSKMAEAGLSCDGLMHLCGSPCFVLCSCVRAFEEAWIPDRPPCGCGHRYTERHRGLQAPEAGSDDAACSSAGIAPA